MAIGFETAVEGGGSANNSFSVNCGTNSNRFLLVTVCSFDFSSATMSTASYNGVAMTEIGFSTGHPTSNIETWYYGIVNPASGSNTLVINVSNVTDGAAITAYPLYNVEQTSVAAAVRDTDLQFTTTNSLSFSLNGVQSSDECFGTSNDFGGGSTWTSITERNEHVQSNTYNSTAYDTNVATFSASTTDNDSTGIGCAIIEVAAAAAAGILPGKLSNLQYLHALGR